MNFCQQTSIGSTGTRVSVQVQVQVHVLWNIDRTGSGNATIETVWWRYWKVPRYPEFASKSASLKKNVGQCVGLLDLIEKNLDGKE